MPSSAFKDMWETIKNEHLWVGEVKNLRKNGSYYWVNASIVPYYDSHKKHVGYSAIRIDITAQKELERLHYQVNNLLQNISQGILSFDRFMSIQKSYSKECLDIFDTNDIDGKNISELLFGNDYRKKEVFDEGIKRIIESDDEMMHELFLSLLPKEHTINNKIVTVEYKMLEDSSFMLVISDVTATKALENKIQDQQQIQKMLIGVASNTNDFIELKLDFENFIANPIMNSDTLLRELHTFKGIFAQKEMLNIVKGIHTLESRLNELIVDGNTDNLDTVCRDFDLATIFNRDLQIIADILGEEFLETKRSLNIDISQLKSIETKLKRCVSNKSVDVIDSILYDFEKIQEESVYKLLSVFPSAVKQVSIKLNKNIYPLEIKGESSLCINAKFKPFIKSLIHLFNNCVEHGIENIEDRIQTNKDEIGLITCDFYAKKSYLYITISDDGGGIDTNKLLSSAIEKKLFTKEQLNQMNENEKLFLLFTDKLSSKEELSHISGRGVGMSAIKEELDKVSGEIQIINTISQGAKFIFKLPIK